MFEGARMVLAGLLLTTANLLIFLLVASFAKAFQLVARLE